MAILNPTFTINRHERQLRMLCQMHILITKDFFSSSPSGPKEEAYSTPLELRLAKEGKKEQEEGKRVKRNHWYHMPVM